MLFSTDIPPCEGVASHVVDLAKRLKKRGHRIVLMTRSNRWGKVEFEYEGFRVIKVPFYPLYPFHVYCHGCFVLRGIKSLSPQPDLVHLHSPLTPPLPKKWPLVTTFHTSVLVDSTYVENLGLRTLLMKLMGKTTSYWIEKKLLDISDSVITVSQGVGDELRSFYGYRRPLYLLPNVVDTDFYKPSTFNQKKKKLLYIGRLGYRKGLFEIVESAKSVIKDFPDVKYIIVGSGPLRDNVKRAINNNGLGQNFEFCGEIRDNNRILQYYQDAYAVLIPSYYEGLPMVLLEAMACGKPIITTNANFSKGIIENGINALLIEPKSAQGLEKATMKLLSSEELCRSLGRAARKTAVETMDLEANTDKVEEVYELALREWRLREER